MILFRSSQEYGVLSGVRIVFPSLVILIRKHHDGVSLSRKLELDEWGNGRLTCSETSLHDPLSCKRVSKGTSVLRCKYNKLQIILPDLGVCQCNIWVCVQSPYILQLGRRKRNLFDCAPCWESRFSISSITLTISALQTGTWYLSITWR